MKTPVVLCLALCAGVACAQSLRHYDRPGTTPGDDCMNMGLGQRGMSDFGGEFAAPPLMRAEERSGITAKEMMGEGTGTMISMQSNPWSSTSYGALSGMYYMMRAGAYVVPMFGQVRHNFWSMRDDGVFGSAYGYAAGGPAVGIGQSLYAPTFSSFMQSLTFRVGAGAMTGLGLELGGRAFGWSMFTEAGAMGFAFTAPLGPQRTYAAPFLAVGIRRAFGN